MELEPRLKKLADQCRMSLGLEAYELHAAQIYMERCLQGLRPVFAMEWFPPGAVLSREDGINPESTAVADVDIQSGRLRRVMFAGGRTFADKLQFDKHHLNELINWVERTTGWNQAGLFLRRDGKQRRSHGCKPIDAIKESSADGFDFSFSVHYS